MAATHAQVQVQAEVQVQVQVQVEAGGAACRWRWRRRRRRRQAARHVHSAKHTHRTIVRRHEGPTLSVVGRARRREPVRPVA